MIKLEKRLRKESNSFINNSANIVSKIPLLKENLKDNSEVLEEIQQNIKQNVEIIKTLKKIVGKE